MKKRSKIIIIAIFLSLLSFKEISYYSLNLMQQCKSLEISYSTDPTESTIKPPKSR